MDETSNVKPPGLINIADGRSSFKANGVLYFIQTEISFDRWIMYRKLQVELSFATTFKELFEAFGDAYGLLNELRFADAAVVIRSAMKGLEAVGNEKHTPTVLKLCALFINAEGEDIRYINDDMIKKKTVDWNEAGISISSFFLLALHSIPGFMEVYQKASLDTSSKKESL